MQQKAKPQSDKSYIRKILLITFVIVIVIIGISLLKTLWLNYDNQRTMLQQKLQHMENKIALMYQNLHHDHSYTISQAQEAYDIAKVAAKVLQQDRDVNTAKSLLAVAQEHLNNLQGDKIEQARAALTADMQRLDAIQITDTSTIQAKLDTLDQLIAGITVKDEVDEQQFVTPANTTTGTQTEANTPKSKLKQSWNNVVSDLKSVVKVRKKSAAESGTEDTSRDLKRARFKLLIEEIRWAVFYKDAAVYQRSVTAAQHLVPQIFDANNENVKKIQTILGELAQIQLKTDVPSIQNSINALQAIIVG